MGKMKKQELSRGALQLQKTEAEVQRLGGQVARLGLLKNQMANALAQAREALELTLPFVRHGNCDCPSCRALSPGFEAKEKATAALDAVNKALGGASK